MKTNPPSPKLKSGMTRTESIAVICCIFMMLVLAYLFLTAGRGRRGSDRSANIMNIRNCQQAMRAHQAQYGLEPGAPFTRKDLEEYMPFPTTVNSELGDYSHRDEVTSGAADPVDWSHIWLIPGPAGLPGGEFGHQSYDDVSDW